MNEAEYRNVSYTMKFPKSTTIQSSWYYTVGPKSWQSGSHPMIPILLSSALSTHCSLEIVKFNFGWQLRPYSMSYFRYGFANQIATKTHVWYQIYMTKLNYGVYGTHYFWDLCRCKSLRRDENQVGRDQANMREKQFSYEGAWLHWIQIRTQ